ncbi:hypothetical protein ASF41_17295 [Methylobacterium sp. Leaf111]|uniref:hypothetical protein n=1 Tax=Methylobacterium sp. Leaf111 TaxID=1736257 RepID=UPI0006F428FB|nr:hypothetical protein [Methylobacterium sp. Leaf111]KQP74742.1 hypothetical protein ASF41_17295 [Methylobacterium sp. Leaf111]
MRRLAIGALVLLLAPLLLVPRPARAQGADPARALVADGSDREIGPERADRVIALLGQGLRAPAPARYGQLRAGRAGAFCGVVDTTNRMGNPVGPRRFVADLAAGIAGLVPDGPELRNPATPQDYAALQRILALYAANCAP